MATGTLAWAVIAASVSGSPPWLGDTAAPSTHSTSAVNPHGLRSATAQLDLELAAGLDDRLPVAKVAQEPSVTSVNPTASCRRRPE